MIENVVFDLGEVLLRYDYRSFIDTFSFAPKIKQRLIQEIFLSDTWQKGDEGLISGEEFVDAFSVHAKDLTNEIQLVYSRLGECISLYEETMPLVHKLKEEGYRLYFLSNYSSYMYEQTKETLSFLEEFEGGVFSFQEKLVKPGKEIYKTLINRYDIDVTKTVFIDDRPENIKAGEALGIKGYVCTRELLQNMISGIFRL